MKTFPQKNAHPAFDRIALVRAFRRELSLRLPPKHVRRSVSVVKRFLWFAGRLPDRGNVQAFMRQREAQVSLKTLYNERSCLSSFCRWLQETGRLGDDNPAIKVRLARLPEPPTTSLTEDEVEDVCRLAAEHGCWPEVNLALATGLRLSELCRLRWVDVDVAGRVLLVPVSKSGKPRTVPLSARALKALEAQYQVSGEVQYVFPARQTFPGGFKYLDHQRCPQTMWRLLRPICQAVARFNRLSRGSVGRGWHLLRHTFASRVAARKVSPLDLQHWLGHSTLTLTKRYFHEAEGYDPAIEEGD